MWLHLHCMLAADQCIVISPVCLQQAGGVCGWVCGSVTTKFACIDPHQTGFVGKGSDHHQLTKFWLSRAPQKGVCGGANFFWLRLTTASAQCLHLSEHFFIAFDAGA